MTVWIASDHAGVDLKSAIIKAFPDIDWKDYGPFGRESVDYPDYANLIAEKVNAMPTRRGILICGSGQGMAMRANKFPQVRAALVWNEEVAKLSRSHNDANLLCLAARFTSPEEAQHFVQLFLETPFEGGRHSNRVTKINA
ncbi:MAG: RpiB/LacA/LacB family sugar-phosphate isomerase [Bdellovibrionaceae bacterium]|nr:RpiB/LacA/LacB family sugar-phosphate isomerase [Pseudobdellovibrionaceae bacterium]